MNSSENIVINVDGHVVSAVVVLFNNKKKFVKIPVGATFLEFKEAVKESFHLRCGCEGFEVFNEDEVEITEECHAMIKTKLYIIKYNEENTTSSSTAISLDPLEASSRLPIHPSEASRPLDLLQASSRPSEASSPSGSTSTRPTIPLYVRVLVGELREYFKTQRVIDCNRKSLMEHEKLDQDETKMAVRIAMDHLKAHNKNPSTDEKIAYAKALIEIFPCLRGPTEQGYEHLFNPKTRTGYIFSRLKHLRQCEIKKERIFQDNQKEKIDEDKEEDLDRDLIQIKEQPSGSGIKRTHEVMDRTCNKRKKFLQTERKSEILKNYPRFLDTHGLIQVDFEKSEHLEDSTKALSLKNLLLHTEFLKEVEGSSDKQKIDLMHKWMAKHEMAKKLRSAIMDHLPIPSQTKLDDLETQLMQQAWTDEFEFENQQINAKYVELSDGESENQKELSVLLATHGLDAPLKPSAGTGDVDCDDDDSIPETLWDQIKGVVDTQFCEFRPEFVEGITKSYPPFPSELTVPMVKSFICSQITKGSMDCSLLTHVLTSLTRSFLIENDSWSAVKEVRKVMNDVRVSTNETEKSREIGIEPAQQ
ncbi:hypothetical protein DMENIID0001_115120 [Sergentomyia squamirostris]